MAQCAPALVPEERLEDSPHPQLATETVWQEAGCSEGVADLLAERERLQQQLSCCQERLRKLRMVKTYRSKVLGAATLLPIYYCHAASFPAQTNLEQLGALTSKWRSVAQDAAEQLLASCCTHPPPSMAALLAHMHIDLSLIHYCPTQETFY